MNNRLTSYQLQVREDPHRMQSAELPEQLTESCCWNQLNKYIIYS